MLATTTAEEANVLFVAPRSQQSAARWSADKIWHAICTIIYRIYATWRGSNRTPQGAKVGVLPCWFLHCNMRCFLCYVFLRQPSDPFKDLRAIQVPASDISPCFWWRLARLRITKLNILVWHTHTHKLPQPLVYMILTSKEDTNVSVQFNLSKSKQCMPLWYIWSQVRNVWSKREGRRQTGHSSKIQIGSLDLVWWRLKSPLNDLLSNIIKTRVHNSANSGPTFSIMKWCSQISTSLFHMFRICLVLDDEKSERYCAQGNGIQGKWIIGDTDYECWHTFQSRNTVRVLHADNSCHS